MYVMYTCFRTFHATSYIFHFTTQRHTQKVVFCSKMKSACVHFVYLYENMCMLCIYVSYTSFDLVCISFNYTTPYTKSSIL